MGWGLLQSRSSPPCACRAQRTAVTPLRWEQSPTLAGSEWHGMLKTASHTAGPEGHGKVLSMSC